MTIKEGFNFRATLGYVTDGTDETAVLGNMVYPTVTSHGHTVGWNTNVASQDRDRNSGNDRRLAGFNFATNDGSDTQTFRIDLPDGPGKYLMKVAAGDALFSQNVYIEIYDNSTLLATVSGSTGGVQRFIDATGVVRTNTDWASTNSGIVRTFASSICNVKLGPLSSTLSNTIAHFYIEYLPVTADTGPIYLPGRTRRRQAFAPIKADWPGLYFAVNHASRDGRACNGLLPTATLSTVNDPTLEGSQYEYAPSYAPSSGYWKYTTSDDPQTGDISVLWRARISSGAVGNCAYEGVTGGGRYHWGHTSSTTPVPRFTLTGVVDYPVSTYTLLTNCVYTVLCSYRRGSTVTIYAYSEMESRLWQQTITATGSPATASDGFRTSAGINIPDQSFSQPNQNYFFLDARFSRAIPPDEAAYLVMNPYRIFGQKRFQLFQTGTSSFATPSNSTVNCLVFGGAV